MAKKRIHHNSPAIHEAAAHALDKVNASILDHRMRLASARLERISHIQVGDLLFHIPSGRLAYCTEVNRERRYASMMFPGEEKSSNYSFADIAVTFRY